MSLRTSAWEARGKDLSNDTPIRVTSSIEPQICTKMLRNLSKKLEVKFPSTTLGCSTVRKMQFQQKPPGVNGLKILLK